MATKPGSRSASRRPAASKKKTIAKKATAKVAAKRVGKAAAAAVKTSPDWGAIRLVYVNTSLSYASIAEQFGQSASAVEKRGEREGWAEQRRKLSEKVGEKAQAAITEKRIKELEEFNETDLKVARAIRARVAEAIMAQRDAKDPLPANDLRSLAGAAEVAQRMGRLALGATTSSHSVTGTVNVKKADEMSDDELATIAARGSDGAANPAKGPGQHPGLRQRRRGARKAE